MANQTILQNIRSHRKSAFLLSGAVQSLRNLQCESDEVEWAVINKFGKGRPSMELDELVPQLMARHAQIDIAGKVLRLCMYCLGFFNKQSFTLDHFRPVNRGVQSADFNFQSSAHDYNNPANLVAVCHSCNSSKSNYSVNRQWVAGRTKKRQDDGLPGFEMTAGPGDDADQLVEEAIDTIGTVLNLS